MKKATPEQHAGNIYSPIETAALGKELAQRAAEQRSFGIALDIKGTDAGEYIAPLLPWEICAIQAQTSNGKTMFTTFWERQIAAQLEAQGRDEVIVHVSLEESIEAQAFAEYGNLLGVEPAAFARGHYTDWGKMDWAMTQIGRTPIWRMGDSANRAPDAPELYLSNIYRAIRELADGRVTGDPVKIAVVIVDYLQALPIDPEVKTAAREQQRRLQVAQDVFRLREMTTHLKCPIIVPLQAKQELSGANMPYLIPGMYDGLETSTIATRFDRILSLWMPKTSYLIGTTQRNERTGASLTVAEDQVFLKVVKQRGGLPAGRVWELRVDYKTGHYYDTFYKGK